jgi:uncharacterized ParB-like nuclease family protein
MAADRSSRKRSILRAYTALSWGAALRAITKKLRPISVTGNCKRRETTYFYEFCSAKRRSAHQKALKEPGVSARLDAFIARDD